MTKTPDQFINEYRGKSIDHDGFADVQCVDSFRVFDEWAGYPVKPTVTGWADGYWWYREAQGWGQYFEFITNPKALKKGDWCFWAYGSNSCPTSHVGMFVEYTNSFKTRGTIFSENQGTFRGFSTGEINLDICGAFRPKIFINTTMVTDFVTQLYKNILGRTPDSGGLTAWVNALENGSAAKNVVASFFNSREYSNKKTSDSQFVTDCYHGYLNRNPDTSGYNYWMRKLEGGAGRQAILNGFGNSAEFKRFAAKYGL